jgi:hypothetical protein
MAKVWRKLNLRVTADGAVSELVSDEPSEEAPQAVPVRKLMGKQWFPEAFARRRKELRAMTITDAARLLSNESMTAPDCGRPVSVRYCENLLRDLNDWPKKPRNSPKQRPK